eukprot:scaffold45824_cov60-Phaeocystis_antarctica.AAC.2
MQHGDTHSHVITGARASGSLTTLPRAPHRSKRRRRQCRSTSLSWVSCTSVSESRASSSPTRTSSSRARRPSSSASGA